MSTTTNAEVSLNTPSPEQSTAQDLLTTQLLISCINNDISTMKSLIEQKANPNSYCNLFNNETGTYIFNNQTATTSTATTSTATTTTTTTTTTPSILTLPEGNNHNTLLHAAILSQSIPMIQYVVDDLHINNFNQLDYRGNDSLLISFQLHNYTISEYLMNQYELDLNILDIQHLTNHYPPIEILHQIFPPDSEYQDKVTNILYLTNLIEKGLFYEFKFFVEQFNVTLIELLPNTNTFFERDLFPRLDFLSHAVKHNQLKFIDYLLSKGLALENSLGTNTVLFDIIESSSWDIFKYLIEQRQYDPNMRDKKGNTILHQMILSSHATVELIDYCIYNLSLNPNTPNTNGITPIYSFVTDESNTSINIPIIQHLIQVHKVDITPPQNTKSTPFLLHRVLQSRQCTLTLIQLLDEYNQVQPHIDITYNSRNSIFNGDTPFQIAIMHCSMDIIQFLISKITLPQLTKHTKQFYRQLRYNASKNRDPNVLDYVLQLPQIKDGITPPILNQLLNDSVNFHGYVTTKLLIEKYNGYSILTQKRKKGDDNDNLLQRLFSYYSYRDKFNHELFHYLINLKHFDLNKQYQPRHDYTKLSLLSNMMLIPACSIEDVQCIIANGGQYDQIQDEDGATILHLATKTVGLSVDVIGYLIDLGSDVTKVNNKGQTFLFNLIEHNQFNSLYHLLCKYPSLHNLINQQDENGDTLVHYAISKNNFDIFRCLLSYNPNINIRNKSNHTPLFHAIKMKLYIFAAFLLRTNPNCNVDNRIDNQQSILHIILNPHIDGFDQKKSDKHSLFVRRANAVADEQQYQFIDDIIRYTFCTKDTTNRSGSDGD